MKGTRGVLVWDTYFYRASDRGFNPSHDSESSNEDYFLGSASDKGTPSSITALLATMVRG